MEYKLALPRPSKKLTPRLIIHGGAGNITPSNLPPGLYKQYHSSLLSIVSNAYHYLLQDHDALDAATFAVEQLENNPLFNSGHGAVFTRDGINELEASVMVSRGKKKRGVGIMGLRHVKNPIKLAREMLIRGERDLEGGNGEHRGPMVEHQRGLPYNPLPGGAQGHSQLYGESAEELARQWGLDMVDESYFFVQKRWDEHIAGLEREKSMRGQAGWDGVEYVPQGTCGAVVMDADGICCVATSTGGMTNKLSGRIGDTPTLGAGFWAEEWEESVPDVREENKPISPVLILSEMLRGYTADCLPSLSTFIPISTQFDNSLWAKEDRVVRATAVSGSGNGDSFLRLNAVRTASAVAKYRAGTSLQKALTEVTGPDGDLMKSAGDRWQKTGEGEGGMIGVECKVTYDREGVIKVVTSKIAYDYNCGGMFKAFINEKGKAVCRVWKPGQYERLEEYEGEAVEYDVYKWLSEKL